MLVAMMFHNREPHRTSENMFSTTCTLVDLDIFNYRSMKTRIFMVPECMVRFFYHMGTLSHEEAP